MIERTARASRRRDEGGAASQRQVLALAASALLTAAVALPMAYQAHEARTADEPEPRPAPEVLGTSTIPTEEPAVLSDGLYWSTPPDLDPMVLHGATVTPAPRLFVDVDDVVRADFRLDEGAVETDTEAPFELADGQPVDLGTDGAEGDERSLTVTITFEGGRSEVRQAFFTVAAG
jgi:hypothetical protein